MILKIDLTEEQKRYLQDEMLLEVDIDKLICEMIPKLVQDTKMDYNKNMMLVSVLSDYLKQRKELDKIRKQNNVIEIEESDMETRNYL